MYKNAREQVDSRFYLAIHYWLKKKFGVADKCENKKCEKKSSNYSWAKKPNAEYDFKRKNFKKLCYSCHAKLDTTQQTREYMRKINVNTGKTHCKNGHEFTKDNTYMIGKWRSCKKCRFNRRLAFQRKENGVRPENFKASYFPTREP